MSICNIHLTRHRGLVAVDTRSAVIGPTGKTIRFGEAQKIAVIGTVLVAARGNLGIYSLLIDDLVRTDRIWSFDTLLPDLEDRCVKSSSRFGSFSSRAIQGELPEIAKGLEVFVVGWSDRFDSVCGVVASQSESNNEFLVEHIELACAAPGVWGLERLPNLSTVSAMLAAMQEQTHIFSAQYPSAPIGGRALIYEVTPVGISSSSPFDIP